MFPYSFFARSMGWGPSKWLYFVHSPKLLETVLYKAIEVTTWQTVDVVHVLTLSMQVKFQSSAVSNVLSFGWWAGTAAQTLHLVTCHFQHWIQCAPNFCALCLLLLIHLKVLIDSYSFLQCLCILVGGNVSAMAGLFLSTGTCPQAWVFKHFSSEEQLCSIKRCRCP